MLISEKYNYIFVSIPKTGTTAIQSFLLENDNSCRMNWVEINGEGKKVKEHAKAKEIKKILGEEYDKYTVFTFIRDPFLRRVSGYFFYKNGDIMKSHYFIRNFMARLNVILTKLLPFSIWSIVKPQKKLVDYFFDDNNNLLIDLVGKTESLDEDLSSICRLIGIPLEAGNVPVKNSSSHSVVQDYFSSKFHRKIYSKLIERDLKLYDRYKDRITTEKYDLKNMLVYD